MPAEEFLQQVVNRWKAAFGQRDTLKASCEAAVVRWEWATGERFSLLPYYFNRYPGRARALKQPPAAPGYYVHYGFDAQDRPRLHYFYNYQDLTGRERLEQDRSRDFATDWMNETYYSYLGSRAEVIEYSVPPRIPLKVQQIFYEDGLVSWHARFGLNGYTPLYSEKGRDPQELYDWLGYNGRYKQYERYQYKDGLLARIQLYYEAPGVSPKEVEDRFTFNDAGKLLRIGRYDQHGNSQLLYRRREKGQTFKSLQASAIEKLTRAIIERVKVEDIRERLCCLELSYLSGYSHFPPLIFPGLEADRQRLLASDDPEALYFVFAPAIMGDSQGLEIRDPETVEICSQLEQEIRAGEKWDAARAALREVAAALTRHDWRGVLETTPDFVAFAIDWEMEGDQLEQVLGASATPAQMKEWRAKGWL